MMLIWIDYLGIISLNMCLQNKGVTRRNCNCIFPLVTQHLPRIKSEKAIYKFLCLNLQGDIL